MDISALEDALAPFMTFADNIRDFLTLPVEILKQLAVWFEDPSGELGVATEGNNLSSGLTNLFGGEAEGEGSSFESSSEEEAAADA